MKSTLYTVYAPPKRGLPYLAVTLMPDGTATARPFDTEIDAATYIREVAAGGARDPSTH
ncbi:hypothetical protein ACSBOB_11515 [Mesorhizobium sp. ASY16-5R]|uniref:hypothetical protein n=1 Tax=Mesorhizobium sp. ASY16-5R TaxID=3445772 RepID=UPI003F9F1A41